ncbi:hypothetical protein [Bradyrhizobium sp. USDA 10063]
MSTTDLEELFRSIEPTIRDAEQHLGVAAGTLGDIRHDTDYLAIVKMHATIEPLLNEALEESVTRALKHPKVAFPGGEALADFVTGANFDAKVRLALESELISDQQARFIRAVAKLRNYYAHNVGRMSKSIFDATADLDKQGDGIYLQRDLFMGATNNQNKEAISRLALVYLSPFMFLRFAGLLAALMQGIRPPPVMSDVIRGILHETK